MRVEGEITIDPVAIEATVRETWRAAPKHRAGQAHEEAQAVLGITRAPIPGTPETWIPPPTGGDLWRAAHAGPTSPPGLDGWAPTQLGMI